MKIEIDDDCVDSILQASLVESYISISRDIKSPEKWHEDDIANWKELLPALKTVGEWYCFDFDGLVKKAKKSK
jgi:hypothetical protein